MLDGVTNAIAQSRTRINMHVQYKHITGIVPHTIKLKRSPENNTCNFGYAGIIVFHRDSNVVGRGKSFFKKLFQSALPELFPEEIDDDTTGADGFITVGGKKKSSNATSTALSVKETVSKLSALIQSSISSDCRFYIVIGGRGGRRSVGVYPIFNDGVCGAKFVWLGVSGAYIKGFDNENEAWVELEARWPGLNSPAALRKFHSLVPHTEDNFSPTHSELDGPARHKFGAEAFTYTEADDAELLLLRMEANRRITGHDNAPIRRGDQYFASRFNPEMMSTEPPQQNNPQASNTSGLSDSQQEEEAFEDFPFSQDHLPDYHNPQDEAAPQDASQSESSKRSTSPAKKRKVEEETEPAGPKPPIDDSMYDCYPIAISLPDSATLYDTILYLNSFSPGLGNHWPGQARLGTFKPFPLCQVVILHCPKNLSRSLREYVHTHKMWDKWQLFSGRITSESQVTYKNSNTAASSFNESLARDPLVQCVKHTIHPKHEVDFLLLLDANPDADGQFIFNYYLKHWKDDAFGKISVMIGVYRVMTSISPLPNGPLPLVRDTSIPKYLTAQQHVSKSTLPLPLF
jgi:hypothetical protein